MAPFIMKNHRFIIHLDDKETIVECKQYNIFLKTNIETEAIFPHQNKECDCLDVQHVSYFRLKTLIIQPDRHTHERHTVLFVAHEPTDGYVVESVVVEDCPSLPPLPTSYMTLILKYRGWNYLTTIPSSLGLFKMSMKLYRNRQVKYAPIPAAVLNFSDNLSQLLMDGTYSDVTISSNDGATIKAHRGILAKRCEVFRAALEHNETTDQITSHFHEKTLRQIMTYIYTDKTPKIGDFTADLFIAADYYQLSNLKNVCIAAFYKQLKVENAIATLELAERYSLANLLTFTLEFVKNNFDLIEKTKDWDNIKSVDLVKIVCKYIAQKSK